MINLIIGVVIGLAVAVVIGIAWLCYVFRNGLWGP